MWFRALLTALQQGHTPAEADAIAQDEVARVRALRAELVSGPAVVERSGPQGRPS